VVDVLNMTAIYVEKGGLDSLSMPKFFLWEI
jgi:hypothetical protein